MWTDKWLASCVSAESEDEVDEDFDAPEPTEAEAVDVGAEEEKEVLRVEKKARKPVVGRYVDPERQKGSCASLNL